MYDLNPTENLFVERCLYWVSYFLFCCQNSFHLLSSFWLASSRIADTKQQMAGSRVLQRPLSPVRSRLPPRHCSFWQTFKASPAGFVSLGDRIKMGREGTSRCQKINARWGEHRRCVKILSVTLLVQSGHCGKRKSWAYGKIHWAWLLMVLNVRPKRWVSILQKKKKKKKNRIKMWLLCACVVKVT